MDNRDLGPVPDADLAELLERMRLSMEDVMAAAGRLMADHDKGLIPVGCWSDLAAVMDGYQRALVAATELVRRVRTVRPRWATGHEPL